MSLRSSWAKIVEVSALGDNLDGVAVDDGCEAELHGDERRFVGRHSCAIVTQNADEAAKVTAPLLSASGAVTSIRRMTALISSVRHQELNRQDANR